LGFLSTILGSFGLYIKGNRDQEKKLRRAFYCEIKNMEEVNSLKELKPSSVPPQEVLSTHIYEQNVSEIGLLTEEEIRMLISYYNHVLTAKEGIRLFHESNISDSEALNGIANISSGLPQQRKEILETLSSNLD